MGGSIAFSFLEQIGYKGVVCQQFDRDCRLRTDGTLTLFESRMRACAMNDLSLSAEDWWILVLTPWVTWPFYLRDERVFF